jgi:hypothetical protein
MRYGYSKADGHDLLKRGAVKVFKQELAAIDVMNPEEDELITDTVTPLLKSMAEEYGYKILKASDVPAGLTFEQENTAEFLKDSGYTPSEIAEKLYVTEEAVKVSKAFNQSSIEKSYLPRGINKSQHVLDIYKSSTDDYAAHEALANEYIQKILTLKSKKD